MKPSSPSSVSVPAPSVAGAVARLNWLRAAAQGDSAAALQPKAVESKSKEPHTKPRKRKTSPEGKLAIRLGVALRHWKAANPEASEEDVAKQRERMRQQLQRKAS
jgi:hypothetical protein